MPSLVHWVSYWVEGRTTACGYTADLELGHEAEDQKRLYCFLWQLQRV